jgi:hypothetical protein
MRGINGKQAASMIHPWGQLADLGLLQSDGPGTRPRLAGDNIADNRMDVPRHALRNRDNKDISARNAPTPTKTLIGAVRDTSHLCVSGLGFG